MDTNTVVMIAAVVAAIVVAICLCLCLLCCCCCCCHNQSARISNKNDDVEKGESNYPLKQFAIGNEETDGNHKFRSKREYTRTAIYMYDEDEVVERAHSESGTTLWTNDGQVFINHPGNDHAEILFIRNNYSSKESITTLHIKNSPCHDCAAALINYFKYCRNKPTIYMGRIWHLRDTQDDNGLKEMMREGFKLKVWNKLHNRMYSGDTTTANYLKGLRNELYQ